MSLHYEAIMSESGHLLSPVMDRGEEVPTGLLEPVRGLVVAELVRDHIQYFKRGLRFQVVFGLRKGFELLIGRHHGDIPVELAFLALRIDSGLRKEARPMKVDIGIEVLLVQGIDERGPTLGNVGMAKAFTHHRPILTFHEAMIIRLPGPGFGEFDQEFAEQTCHPPIEVFGASIGMESPDAEGKGGQEQGQGREQRGFTDFLHSTDHLELGHLIDGIDVIHPLLFVQVPLMDRVDAEKAGLALGLRFPPLANARPRGPRFSNVPTVLQIPR